MKTHSPTNPNPNNHDLGTARGFALAYIEMFAAVLEMGEDTRVVEFRSAGHGQSDGIRQRLCAAVEPE